MAGALDERQVVLPARCARAALPSGPRRRRNIGMSVKSPWTNAGPAALPAGWRLLVPALPVCEGRQGNCERNTRAGGAERRSELRRCANRRQSRLPALAACAEKAAAGARRKRGPTNRAPRVDAEERSKIHALHGEGKARARAGRTGADCLFSFQEWEGWRGGLKAQLGRAAEGKNEADARERQTY
jgi:hypothetical protein